MNREPVISVAAITSLVAAAITLVTAFGLPLTPVQTQAILSFVAIAAPLVAAYFQRRRVTPNPPANRAAPPR
jgi:FtsH-binding integral membrane protein